MTGLLALWALVGLVAFLAAIGTAAIVGGRRD